MDDLSSTPDVRTTVAARLRAAGCVAALDEAHELVVAAADDVELARLVERRLAGEPIGWVVGHVTFCGLPLRLASGVYVPRWQTEAVAERAAALLPERGVAVDLCCGCGAVARLLAERKPSARVVAVDVDPAAVRCAHDNGVDASVGDLFEALPETLRGLVDVVVAIAPYVPHDQLPLLAKTPEPRLALDGGGDGLDVVRRIVEQSPGWLRVGGSLVVEIGRPQVAAVEAVLARAGLDDVDVLVDGDGDICGVAARARPRS